MSDALLAGNGFETYETQDKVLVSMDGSVDCGVVVRILQQQGFGVAGASTAPSAPGGECRKSRRSVARDFGSPTAAATNCRAMAAGTGP